MKCLTAGFLLIVCCSAAAADTIYVSTNSLNDGPGTAWSNAFHTIQDAVDAAMTGDTVLVTNGTYSVGGKVTPGYSATNRVCITNAITVQSVNGPGETVVDGADSVRCVYVGGDAVLSGFCLTNGSALIGDDLVFDVSGGGALLTNGMLMDCILSGNRAEYGGGVAFDDNGTLNHCMLFDNTAASDGGGASFDDGGTLNNCMLYGNSAEGSGGGAELYFGGTLNNCVLSGNQASIFGGGADLYYGGILNNCIVWGNESAVSGVDIYDENGIAIRSTCASDGVLNGVDGCITNDPVFMEPIANYRLGYGSPCIDAGDNVYVAVSSDLDGGARIVNTTVDMGAYEYDAEVYDTDSDSVTDADELIADTDPADPDDFFRIISLTASQIGFHSSGARQYTLQFCTNLVEGSWSNILGQVDITGNGGELILTNSIVGESRYYRVQVELP